MEGFSYDYDSYLRARERKEKMEKEHIIFCDECGSSWYGDGFTPCCPLCLITALSDSLIEMRKVAALCFRIIADNELMDEFELHLRENHIKNGFGVRANDALAKLVGNSKLHVATSDALKEDQ